MDVVRGPGFGVRLVLSRAWDNGCPLHRAGERRQGAGDVAGAVISGQGTGKPAAGRACERGGRLD